MRGRIVDLQRTLRERGRLRIGVSEVRKGKKVPRKIDTYRFTSGDRATIEEVSRIYGGTVQPWTDGGSDHWEVITEVDQLPVVLPTDMALSQSYEQWAKGFCVRRCDGERSVTPGTRKLVDEPCSCNPDARDCQLTTNLSLILPDLPGLGVWRLVTHGWYAAVELGGAVELIEQAVSRGIRVPARLGLDQREVRRLDEGKAVVRKFAVPTLDLDHSVLALGAGGPRTSVAGEVSPLPPSSPLPASPSATWRPVDQQALTPAPFVTVADQLADNDRPSTPRANAAPRLPSTGTTPRTAGQAEDRTCDLCGKPYGSDAVTRNPTPGGSRYVHVTCRGSVEAPNAPADSQGQGEGDRDGTSDGDALPVEPAPAPRRGVRSATMTHPARAKMFALTAKAFPLVEGGTVEEIEEYRKKVVLEMCAAFGQPGITSRSEITTVTGGFVLGALADIVEGRRVWTGTELVEP